MLGAQGRLATLTYSEAVHLHNSRINLAAALFLRFVLTNKPLIATCNHGLLRAWRSIQQIYAFLIKK